MFQNGTQQSQLPSDLRFFLQLNGENTLREAARRKIIKVHFSGEFSMQPFVNLDLKALPRAIAWMAKDEYGRSLLYQFVRDTTFFVGVGGRLKSGDEQEPKRRKMHQANLPRSGGHQQLLAPQGVNGNGNYGRCGGNVGAWKKIFVANFPYAFTEADLVWVFGVCGPINRVDIHRNYTTGKSLGRAHVKFVHPGHAAEAIRRLNGTQVGDHRNPRTIRVDYAWNQD